MSSTCIQNIAVCKLDPVSVLTVQDAVELCADWIQNHPEDCPSEVKDYTYDEVVQEFSLYVELEEGLDGIVFKVNLNTDDCNCCVEVWDFIVKHFRSIMVSVYMEIVYASFSYGDISFTVNYVDKDGNSLDVLSSKKVGAGEQDSDTLDNIHKLLNAYWNSETDSLQVIDDITHLLADSGREIERAFNRR